MLPSSDPDRIYLLSGVNLTEKTLYPVSNINIFGVSQMYIPLHSLCVVNITRVTFGSVPHTDRPVVGSRHQLFTRRAEFNIHDRCHMVLQHVQCAVHLPHVEYVSVVIFVGNREVECLHGVPRNGVRRESQDKLVERGRSSQIIHNDRAVDTSRCQDRSLCLVEGNRCDGVDTGGPVEGLGGRRRRPREIVDLDLRRR